MLCNTRELHMCCVCNDIPGITLLYHHTPYSRALFSHPLSYTHVYLMIHHRGVALGFSNALYVAHFLRNNTHARVCGHIPPHTIDWATRWVIYFAYHLYTSYIHYIHLMYVCYMLPHAFMKVLCLVYSPILNIPKVIPCYTFAP